MEIKKLMTNINLFRHARNFETAEAGSTIFKQGDESKNMMYAVTEGEVEIFVDDELEDTIGPGTTLGELGLIDGGTRTATAVAKTDCRLVPIDEAHFNFLVQNTPNFALQIMRLMAERMRLTRSAITKRSL
jgi:CRP-like cAMP-binding protein